MKRVLRASGLAVALIFAFEACQQRAELESFGPEVTANLVVVFKPETSERDIIVFVEEELVVGSFEKSFWLRPGILSIVKADVQGYQALAIRFEAGITRQQEETVKRGIKDSPLVYKVFENVAPEDIATGGRDGEHTGGRSHGDNRFYMTRFHPVARTRTSSVFL